MRKIYLLALPGLIMSLPSIAQDSTRVTTLEEVVISASRTEQPLIEVPRSVTVIGEEKIKNSVYQSVGDLLGAESGVFIVGPNQTPGTNQNVFLRGMNSNQVAVLIDGVRITDPSSPNAAIDLSEMSLTNIDRIEVIRGSHSTIFGGAALGGVINIITKKAPPTGLHGGLSWQGGSFGHETASSTGNLDLNYSNKRGFHLNGSVFQQNAWGLDASEQSDITASFTADRDDFRKTDFALQGGMKKEHWDAVIAFKNVHQYTEIDDGAFSDDENSYLIFDRKLLQYAGRYKFSPAVTISMLGSVSDSERFYEDDSSRVSQTSWDHLYSTGTYFGKLQTYELQLDYHRRRLHGMIGAGLYGESMAFDNYLLYNDPSFPFEVTTNYDTINSRTTTGYAFTHLRYEIGRVNLSGGARVSRHTTAGNFLTFEFNPSWSLDDLLVYGSLSTGFNAPSLYQLYDPSKNFGAYATRGNRNLKPEESMSIEAGIKKQFNSGTYFTLSVYRTRVINSIEYVYLWNGEKPVDQLDFSDDRGDRYMNVAEQKVKGLEAQAFVRLNALFSFEGNISLLDAEVQASPQDVDAGETGGNHVQLYNLGTFLDRDRAVDETVRRPDFTGFSRLNYRPLSELNLHVIYRYTGKRFDARYDASLGPYGALARTEVEAYHLVDVGINWDASKFVSLAAKVENLLDENYREVLGFQTRGRSVYLKVSFRF